MSECENCGAKVLPNATFCEACGHKLGTPAPRKGATGELPSTASPGSLRSELAFLSGSLDQAKARLDQWKQKGDQSRRTAEIEAEQRKAQEEEQRQQKKKRHPLRAVFQFLTGLAALAAFVYLIIRLPRNTSPTLMFQLWNELQAEYFPVE